MKNILQLFALACLLAVGARAQTPQPSNVISMVGANPTFDSKGSLLTAGFQCLMSSTVTVGEDTYAKQYSISWDGADAKTTVIVDGVKYSYLLATQIVLAIANQEYAANPGTQAKAAADAKAKVAP